MTTKQFKPGELLTAADVNQYLVNDPAVLQDFFTELDAVKTQVEELATSLEPMLQDIDPDNPPLVGFMFNKDTYDWSKKIAAVEKAGYKNEYLTTASVTFPSFCEIVEVILLNKYESDLHGYPFFKGSTSYTRNTVTTQAQIYSDHARPGYFRSIFVILKVVKNA